MDRTLEPEYMDTDEEADSYDAMDHSAPNGAFVDRLFRLGAQGRLLDVGTGPGHMPLLICDRDPNVTVVGIDAARTMLAHAERHRSTSPHAPRIEFRIADAKKVDFADGSFDGVFSNTVLHHIPDPVPFLREAWRVRRPGGVFLVRDLFRPENASRADELVALHAADSDDRGRELFRASLHAALEPEELETAAWEAGIVGFEVVVDSDRHMSLQVAASR